MTGSLSFILYKNGHMKYPVLIVFTSGFRNDNSREKRKHIHSNLSRVIVYHIENRKFIVKSP
jgi:hypothetical protein